MSDLGQPSEGSPDGAVRKIVLHEKAFAHLTRGMYRSPASAIRELVSNAWDAQAHEVQIRTGYPLFTELTVTDDGYGFNEDEFKRIVEGGLGNSEKRIRQEDTPSDRPLIGRLGIGLFGIAQICGAFVIASNPKAGKPFKARIRLYSLIKEELDKSDTPRAKKRKTPDGGETVEVHIGDYQMLEFNPEEFETHGTRVVADLLHPVFSSTFREAIKLTDGIPEMEWKDAVQQVSKHHSLQQVGEYFRFVWEIAASAPVPYLSADAVPDGAVKAFQRALTKEKFKVIVDGRELAKPIWFHGNPNGYTVVPIPVKTGSPYNRTVSFSGYILVQEGKQIQPDELRGLMVRVKNVGIGLYDPSLLDYRYNEGPRTRWISGEIYVSEGLEDALNVDRDSFNRFHPQFRFMQQEIHSILRGGLFPPVYKKLKQRSNKRAAEKVAVRRDALSNTVETIYDAAVTKPSSSSPDLVVKSVKIKGSRKSVDVRIQNPDELETKKTNRQLASSILALFDLALLQPNKSEMKRTFTESLLNLLRKW